MKKIRFCLIFFFWIVMILFCGCSLQDKPGRASDGEDLLSDGQYPVSQYGEVGMELTDTIMKNGGYEISLDLANAEEYGLLMERLKFARKTRENSPALYAAIEQLQTRQSRQVETNSRALGVRDEVYEGSQHMIIQMLETEAREIYVSAHGSAGENFNYLYIDVIAWDSSGKALTKYDYVECYSGNCKYALNPTAPTVTAKGSQAKRSRAPWDGLVPLVARADTMMLYEDAGGNFHIQYAAREYNRKQIVYPKMFVLNDPKENISGHDRLGVVTVCLGRSNVDCDYTLMATGGQILMPFKGRIDYFYQIETEMVDGIRKPLRQDGDGNPLSQLELALSLGDTGGMQVLPFGNNDFFWDHPNTRVVANEANIFTILEWDITGQLGARDYIDFGYRLFRNSDLVNFFVTLSVPLRGPGTNLIESIAFIIPENFDPAAYAAAFNHNLIDPDDDDYLEYAYYQNTANNPSIINETQLLPDLQYTLQVVGKGETQNWHNTNPVSYTWTIDTTPPVAELYNLPAKQTLETLPTEIQVGGAGVISYIYRYRVTVNGLPLPEVGWSAQPIDISVPITIGPTNSLFDNAVYTLDVCALDRAGNQQPPDQATEYSWSIFPDGDIDDDGTIDIIEASLSGTPAFYSNTDAASIVVRPPLGQVNYATICEYQLDGNAPVANHPLVNAITFNALAEGSHTLKVRMQRAGILQAIPSEYTWFVDTLPPVTSLAFPRTTDGRTSSTALQLEVYGEDVSQYRYRLDGGIYSVQYDSQTLINLNGLAAGDHVIEIVGFDRAGNMQTVPTQGDWRIEPDLEYAVLSQLPRVFTNSTATVIQVDGDIQFYSYRLDPLNPQWSFALPTEPLGMMPRLQFIWSCLARGTLITMADGSLRPIENVRTGELVKSANLTNGKLVEENLPVYDITTGLEEIPMYRINDNAGRSLLTTQGHPLVLADGTFRLAADLKAGDAILTQQGRARVVTVGQEMYTDTIYNLTLGTKEQVTSKRASGGSTMYANGILVGDNLLQVNEMSRANREQRETLVGLPKKWQRDYKYYLKNRTGL